MGFAQESARRRPVGGAPASVEAVAERATDVWWVAIPAFLARFSVVISEAWRDGLYLTAWPWLGLLVPLVALGIGFFEGSGHGYNLVIGDDVLGPYGPAFVPPLQVPLFIGVAAVTGALSADAGLMLVLGYTFGDLLIAGPVIVSRSAPLRLDWFTLGSPTVAHFEYLIVPQLISYLSLFLLAVMPTVATRLLIPRAPLPPGLANLIGEWPGFRIVLRVTRLVVLAILPAALVYAWTYAAPIFMRVTWSFVGFEPVVIPYYFAEVVVDPTIPAAVLVAALIRGAIELIARRRPGFEGRAIRQFVALGQANRRPAATRRLPRPVTAVLQAAVVAILLAGLLSSVVEGIVIFAAFVAVFLARDLYLPRWKRWATWTTVVSGVPAVLRLAIGAAVSYVVANLVFSFPGMDPQRVGVPGDFSGEVLAICLSLGFLIALLPRPFQPGTVALPAGRRGAKATAGPGGRP